MAGDDNEINHQTEVYDEVDQASMIQMQQTEKALADIRARLAPESHPDFDGAHCLDCGDGIPKPRLAMGKIRCVPCQEARDKHGRQYASKKQRDE